MLIHHGLSRAFSRLSRPYSMKVVPVPVREDNYAYLLIDGKNCAVVDPFDVDKVRLAAAAKENDATPVALLTTHHHWDHSDGNLKFAEQYPDAVIFAGSKQWVKTGQTVPKNLTIVQDQQVLDDSEVLQKLLPNIRIKCLATPCHTQDSICYYATDKSDEKHPGGVFTGDTLFIAGCGRFFEGSASEMHAALSKLGTLPDETIAYVGHEYTESNAKFALSVDPDNAALSRLTEIIRKRKEDTKDTGITTGHTTIGDEKAWNPFMRLQDPAVRKATKANAGTPDSVVMDALREQKNNYRA
ncbi:Metallo-hydrolase/oxidoreductase [Mycena vitilis]|nr:Metallo-hydrolase/oxidoreductase [Mycena vitilis]